MNWRFIASILTFGLIQNGPKIESPEERIKWVKAHLGPGPISCNNCKTKYSAGEYRKPTFKQCPKCEAPLFQFKKA